MKNFRELFDQFKNTQRLSSLEKIGQLFGGDFLAWRKVSCWGEDFYTGLLVGFLPPALKLRVL